MSFLLNGVSNGIGLGRSGVSSTPSVPSGSRTLYKGNALTHIVSSDLTKITYDEITSKVSQVDAVVGSGQLTQDTVADQPIIGQEFLGGYNVFSMNGTNRKFTSNIDIDNRSGKPGRVLGILAKLDPSASGTNQLAGQWGSTQRWKLSSDGNSFKMSISTQYGIFEHSTSAFDPKDWNVCWFSFDPGAGTPNSLHINTATLVGSVTYSNGSFSENTAFGNVKDSSSSSGWEGSIAEIMVFNTGSLSSGDKSGEINSINSFYGNII